MSFRFTSGLPASKNDSMSKDDNGGNGAGTNVIILLPRAGSYLIFSTFIEMWTGRKVATLRPSSFDVSTHARKGPF